MSTFLDNYVGVWERYKEFITKFPDYRIKTHVLEIARERVRRLHR